LERFKAKDLVGFLRASVHARLNILMCGMTGASKTTLGKSVISAVPQTERIITIEDGTRELQLTQPNCVRMKYPKEGASGIGSLELFQAALRMQPDRIMVGELRDDAAWTYVEVVSGYSGSITTLHAHTPSEAMRRLAILFKSSQSGKGFDNEMLVDILSASVDVIVPLEREGTDFSINPVWFVGDENSGTAADLLRRG
jgi:type IV secretion system protein VirB11